MRLAGLPAALIAVATFAAAVTAQKAPQTQDEVFVEGLAACAAMFSERHPAAAPAPFPPSSSPFIDNGFGKERAAAYGFKPLPVEDLLKAGWEAEQNMLGQLPSIELAKQGAWGRALLRQADLSCSASMFASRDGLLDADSLLMAAAAWVVTTYPGASVVGKVETLDERSKSMVRGNSSAVRRTLWESPDGMRISLSITRPDGERGAVIVSTRMSYSPTQPQPAVPRLPPI